MLAIHTPLMASASSSAQWSHCCHMKSPLVFCQSWSMQAGRDLHASISCDQTKCALPVASVCIMGIANIANANSFNGFSKQFCPVVTLLSHEVDTYALLEVRRCRQAETSVHQSAAVKHKVNLLWWHQCKTWAEAVAEAHSNARLRAMGI